MLCVGSADSCVGLIINYLENHCMLMLLTAVCRLETKLLEIKIYCGNSCKIRGRNNIFDYKMGSVNVFDKKENVLGWPVYTFSYKLVKKQSIGID